MKRLTNIAKALSLIGLVAFGFTPIAVSAYTLPTVESCGYPAPNDNLLCYRTESDALVYVASEHDEWISYSANALTQLANDFGYDSLSEWSSLPPQGSGSITTLFSFNSAQNDPLPDATIGTGDTDPSAPDIYTDQTATGDELYYGVWPSPVLHNDKPNEPYPVTVEDILILLNGEGNPYDLTQLVLVYDLNNADLSLTGKLEILNTSGVVQGEWAFDDTANNTWDFDPDKLWDNISGDLLTTPILQGDAVMVDADENVTVTWYDPLNDSTGCDVTGLCTMYVNNNVGSGKPDFYGYAPTLDLADFALDDELEFTLYLEGLVSGGEELSLDIQVLTPTVSEPSILALFGLSLLGLVGIRKRMA